MINTKNKKFYPTLIRKRVSMFVYRMRDDCGTRENGGTVRERVILYSLIIRRVIIRDRIVLGIDKRSRI